MASERVQRQIDRFLDEAEQAMSHSDWETARDRSNSALALDPGNADAQAFLAAADRALGAPQAREHAVPAGPEPQPSLAETPADPRQQRSRGGRWSRAVGLLVMSGFWFLLSVADESDEVRGLLIIAGILPLAAAWPLFRGNKGWGWAVIILVVASFAAGGWGIGMLSTEPGDGELIGDLFPSPTPTPFAMPTPVPGSASGSLLHDDDGTVETAYGGVGHQDLLAEAVFANPHSASEGSWSQGIMLRRSGVNRFHAVGIRSGGSWFHVVRSGTFESARTAGSGVLSNLDLSAFGENHARVVAQGDQGWLFVNGSFIAPLDLSEWSASGDVGVMAGFFAGEKVLGSSTGYRGFNISPVTLRGGPVSGELQHSAESLAQETIGGSYANVMVEARFTNPNPGSGGSWNYGLIFRNPAFNEFHAVVLFSDGRWLHQIRAGTLESSATVAQGQGSFGTEVGDTNLVRLIAIDDAGWLFVNGQLTATLDLSAATGPSGVSVMTGMFEDHSIPGRSTSFADFTVWSLPLAATPPSL